MLRKIATFLVIAPVALLIVVVAVGLISEAIKQPLMAGVLVWFAAALYLALTD